MGTRAKVEASKKTAERARKWQGALPCSEVLCGLIFRLCVGFYWNNF